MSTNSHTCTPQNNELATYAAKLDKAEAELNWNESALILHRKIRAYIPWPVAQFTYTEPASKKEHRIRIWQASVITKQPLVLFYQQIKQVLSYQQAITH